MASDFERHRPSNVTNGYQTCQKCGCPHKMEDAICSFCGAKLLRKISFSDRFKRAVERAKWRYKLKAPRRSPKSVAKNAASKLVTLILGVALTVVGGWFLLKASQGSGLTDFLVGAIFSIYGVYAVINVVRKKE
ncbi:hypothetical protein MNBD_NITROSPINAE04-1557 [hydrothermal vent metagenome]|uniref:Zinc ribbon domain-containing protein n=1 Tax=hydrothermal vent metagenome TaxID=652676 RepID=A0A3B1C669_9ZZZZ